MRNMSLGSNPAKKNDSAWPAGDKFIGEKLALARSDSGDEASDIADYVGVNTALYLLWEQGQRRPSDEQLEAIAKWHGLSVESLLEFQTTRDAMDTDFKKFLGGIHADTPEENFRQRLNWLMLSHKTTPEAVGEQLGVKAYVVEAWSDGTASPLLSDMAALAKLFDVNVVALIA